LLFFGAREQLARSAARKEFEQAWTKADVKLAAAAF
jgi:hypothetical protein